MTSDCTTTLDQLRAGERGRVETFAVCDEASTRLMELGLVPGTPVEVARVAPLGDPIDVVVRGYHLSLRKSEAKRISVVADNSRS